MFSQNSNNQFTCFSKPSLIRIIKSWNQYYNDNKITYNKSDSNYKLWKKLDQKLKKNCNDEFCWIKQDFMKQNNIVKEDFKPEMPNKWKSNKNEWLNTLNIEDVLKQYEKKYDDFVFIGAVPIDFDTKLHPGLCVVNELCNIDLLKLSKKGKKKIGIVFNLDKHYEPGSHWVALYGDFDKINKIYYFDSTGYSEPSEVTDLMNKLKNQAKDKLNKDVDLHVNVKRHQFKNTECGVYSVNFILNLLKGKKYEDIIENVITDDEMEKNRYKLFIKYDN